MRRRLTERDLSRIVRSVINEQAGQVKSPGDYSKLKRHLIKITEEGQKITITVDSTNAVLNFPCSGPKAGMTFTESVPVADLKLVLPY